MSTRFVLVTDTHYHPTADRDWGAPKMLTRAGEVLDASVPAINAVAPDFIVHGGDLVCGGGSFDLSRADYDRSLGEVADAYQGLTAPIHYVPGNHDCDARTSSFEPLFEAFAMPRLLDIVEVAPGLCLALANIYHDGGTTGRWTEALDAALRQADARAKRQDKALLLILHEWILPRFVRPGDADDVGCIEAAGRLRQTLIECRNVVATFSGHQHENRVRLWHDLVIIDTACLIGFPLGFREITLDAAGFMTYKFHTLNCPELLEASQERSSREANDRYAGEEADRNGTVLLPRLGHILQNSGTIAAETGG